MTVLLQVSPSSKFQEDLGLDSLDSVEVRAGLPGCDSAAICSSKGMPSSAALDVKAGCTFLAAPASDGLGDAAATLLADQGSRSRLKAALPMPSPAATLLLPTIASYLYA